VISQGDFLESLGAGIRYERLIEANRDDLRKLERIDQDFKRLIYRDSESMGQCYKVLAAASSPLKFPNKFLVPSM